MFKIQNICMVVAVYFIANDDVAFSEYLDANQTLFLHVHMYCIVATVVYHKNIPNEISVKAKLTLPYLQKIIYHLHFYEHHRGNIL